MPEAQVSKSFHRSPSISGQDNRKLFWHPGHSPQSRTVDLVRDPGTACQKWAGKEASVLPTSRQRWTRYLHIPGFLNLRIYGRECDVFLKTLASEICSKHEDLRSPAVMVAIRAKLELAILRWNITCLRDSRRSYILTSEAFYKNAVCIDKLKNLSISFFFLSLSLSLTSLSLSLSPPLSLSLPLFLSLSLSLTLELYTGLTMYHCLRYGGDLCCLLSLFFVWLAWSPNLVCYTTDYVFYLCERPGGHGKHLRSCGPLATPSDAFSCLWCDRVFKQPSGLGRHKQSCPKRPDIESSPTTCSSNDSPSISANTSLIVCPHCSRSFFFCLPSTCQLQLPNGFCRLGGKPTDVPTRTTSWWWCI